jgi:DNA primase
MPRIPDTELERLKNEVSVERLVEASGVELKKAGKDMLGRCPFHDDAEASLVVTAAKNLWHCFGCQVGGGPIDPKSGSYPVAGSPVGGLNGPRVGAILSLT